MPTAATARRLRHRVGAFVAVLFVAATGTLFLPSNPAAAAPPLQGQCSTQQWQDPTQWDSCVSKLDDLTTDEVQCVMAPTAETPDAGLAGWFAAKPDAPPSRADGRFMVYGYAGYDFTTYDIGCVPTLMHPDYKFENTVANGEFMLATAVVGASDGLREKAWNPASMWGWSDPIVRTATSATYHRVFTVFGVITLMVIGLYLLWRSRQSDMNNAMTIAGWAVLVMALVTAIARYPVESAQLADRSLIAGLTAVHEAVGPGAQDIPNAQCQALPHPEQCLDHRTPAERASDVAVQNMLYRNWLRGTLGSADSTTAQKYGPILYDAKSLTWDEYQAIKAETEKYRDDPKNPNANKQRQDIISRKQKNWEKVAKEIKTEDPEAYQYLQGSNGMDRIGSGFIALLSSVFFALFDITASILVLLGFLIFRWAVIAAPVLGTVGMLRPASTGIRRLLNAVIAAIFNIIIFGTGAAIYLFAVDTIMSTASLPAWLQLTLVLLVGVVGWMLLRPYRRITQLGGNSSGREMALATRHRSFFRDLRSAATLGVATEAVESMVDRRRGSGGPVPDAPRTERPETRLDGPDTGPSRGAPPGASPSGTSGAESARPRVEERGIPEERTTPATRNRPQWTGPDHPEAEPQYAVYRPGSRDTGTSVRGRRPESADVGG